MDIQLRVATTDDIPAIRELIPASVRALSDGYTSAQIESALKYIFGVDTQLIEDGTYIVAESNGQMVGAGGWSKRQTLYGGDQSKGEADPLLDPSRDAARIRAFYTHPDYARRGIGRSIMQACEDGARQAGFKKMELGSTVAGEPLYTIIGFKVTRRIDIAMPDGTSVPAAMMEKVLE